VGIGGGVRGPGCVPDRKKGGWVNGGGGDGWSRHGRKGGGLLIGRVNGREWSGGVGRVRVRGVMVNSGGRDKEA